MLGGFNSGLVLLFARSDFTHHRDVLVATGVETPKRWQRRSHDAHRTRARQAAEGEREAQARPRRHDTGTELTRGGAEWIHEIISIPAMRPRISGGIDS